MSEPYRLLDRTERQLIEHYFTTRFREDRKLGSVDLWYRVISDFLGSRYKDSDIILSSTRAIEYQVMQEDATAKEYVDALIEIVKPGYQLSDHQRMVLLLTSTNEEREQAAKLALL